VFSVTKGIVDLHHGKISVHSAGEGCGSTFVVDLPVRRKKITSIESNWDRKYEYLESNTPSAPAAITITRSASVVSSSSTLRVLVVDDAALNRKMLRNLLRTRCDLIHEAGDGVEAVERVAEALLYRRAYHVVLMDNLMPNKCGPAAAAEMRAMGYKGMIVGVTGCASPHEVQLFQSHGADCVLQKPLQVDVVDQLLSGKYDSVNESMGSLTILCWL